MTYEGSNGNGSVSKSWNVTVATCLPTDVDYNGVTNEAYLDIISSNLGRTTYAPYSRYDVTGYGVVDIYDITLTPPNLRTILSKSIRYKAKSLIDVSSLVLSLEESGVKNVVLVSDKGFYSLNNINEIYDNGKLFEFLKSRVKYLGLELHLWKLKALDNIFPA